MNAEVQLVVRIALLGALLLWLDRKFQRNPKALADLGFQIRLAWELPGVCVALLVFYMAGLFDE